MAIGGFLSSALFPPVNAFLIDWMGWRLTWVFWGIMLLVMFVPSALIFVRNRPEDIGEKIDGQKSVEHKQKSSLHVEIEEKNWTLKHAMKTRAFWLILFCVSVPALVNTGITFHLVSMMEEKGLTTETAAIVLSLMAVIGFPVTFVTGYLVDRFQVHYILMMTFVGHIAAIVLLWQVESVAGAIMYGILWGMISGLERIVLNIVWPNYFGREHLGSIKGIAQTVMVLGSAFGPLPFGIFYDTFGGYDEILFVMIGLPLLAAVFAFISPKPSFEKYHSEHA